MERGHWRWCGIGRQSDLWQSVATADLHLCLGVARYFELRAEQAAQRDADRVVRQLRDRITEYENRQAIRRSLAELRT